MAEKEISPITGILAEDMVFLDFGEHEGKSILEISDTEPDYYDFLKDMRRSGNFSIKRTRDKIFRLYCHTYTTDLTQ